MRAGHSGLSVCLCVVVSAWGFMYVFIIYCKINKSSFAINVRTSIYASDSEFNRNRLFFIFQMCQDDYPCHPNNTASCSNTFPAQFFCACKPGWEGRLISNYSICTKWHLPNCMYCQRCMLLSNDYQMNLSRHIFFKCS